MATAVAPTQAALPFEANAVLFFFHFPHSMEDQLPTRFRGKVPPAGQRRSDSRHEQPIAVVDRVDGSSVAAALKKAGLNPVDHRAVAHSSRYRLMVEWRPSTKSDGTSTRDLLERYSWKVELVRCPDRRGGGGLIYIVKLTNPIEWDAQGAPNILVLRRGELSVRPRRWP